MPSRHLDHAWRRIALLAIVSAIASASTSAASPATPDCAASSLVVWLNTESGGAAAGSSYYKVEFTNLSGRACALRGYPGVSAIDLRGRQLGKAAGRSPTAPLRTVTLLPRASATAVLQVADALNYPAAACKRTTAAGLRVYPPNQTRAKTVPFPFLACSKPAPTYLHVARVQRA